MNETNYYSNKSPSYGTMLDVTNGVHDHFQRGDNGVGVIMPNLNQCNTSSKNDSTYSSARGPKVMTHVKPLGLIYFMLWLNKHENKLMFCCDLNLDSCMPRATLCACFHTCGFIYFNNVRYWSKAHCIKLGPICVKLCV